MAILSTWTTKAPSHPVRTLTLVALTFSLLEWHAPRPEVLLYQTLLRRCVIWVMSKCYSFSWVYKSNDILTFKGSRQGKHFRINCITPTNDQII